MINAPRQQPLTLYIGVATALGTLFAIDILTTRGYADWILYIGAVAMCWFSPNRWAPVLTAAIASILMVFGYFLSPENATLELSFYNRLVGAITLWILAVVTYQHIVSRERMRMQNWLQHGVARLAAGTRGEHTVHEVADTILRTLVSYVGANVATLYGQEGGRLNRLAAWALSGDAPLPDSVAMGEGLLGQAALENRIVHVRGLAAGYLNINSTLGSGPAQQLLIAPITADGDVVGAIELGYARAEASPDAVMELLRNAAETMGMSIRTAIYRTRLEDLLLETQRQSEELQVQQEELRASNEELEARGRALSDSKMRLEAQQANLEQSNVRLEEHAYNLERQKQELMSVQEALAANARELEQANVYKSEFLANMSHELRTPLNSSLILSRLLLENRDGNLSPDQVRYASTIHSANSDLLDLINDILDLSRVEAGHVVLDLEPLRLTQVLEPLEQIFQPIADQKSLGFRILRAPGTAQTLRSDLQRVQQILKNLLSNAFKFTETGEVVLRVSSPDDQHVRFDVEDTGIGVPKEQQEAIFNAFRQGDGTARRKFGGSGLGLSIAREFADLLQGHVSVASTPGQGSTFSLVLPCDPQPVSVAAAAVKDETLLSAIIEKPLAETPAAGAEPPPAYSALDDDRHDRQRGERLILVVEDDEAFARILYDLAHELDFDCIHAPTAHEGIRLAREMSPCGILLDMGLPDNSGLLVLEQLKRDSATRHIPIHVVSVADHTETALHMGAVGYSLKPTAREKMIEAIATLEERFQQRMRRILVIEDDEMLRDNIALLLGTDNIEIIGIGTLRQAKEQIAGTRFDCIVMDLSLPDGTGYELLETMAKEDPHSMPPVIVYTGRSLNADDERRLRRYSSSIIIKGARSPERLLDEVTLFLHSVEAELPSDRQRMLKEVRQRDTMFEGRTILLAEDDIRNIFALSQVIEPLGAQLEIARNGREAVEALSKPGHNIDLVLMDIMMPEMDGLAAMEAIRKRPDLAKLPIIALTAQAMPADRQRCLDAGANDYISKPVDIDKLLSLCRVWLPH